MKILLVIHGYPPYYMAGSEVYTYNLAHELVKNNEVFVFTRIEDNEKPLYHYSDVIEDNIHIRRINNGWENRPEADFYDKYLNSNIDEAFRNYLKEVKPDIVHIGHLSHLSTSLPIIAKREFGLPVFFTIHDFWMFCHRGQMINPNGLHICDLPNTKQCAECARFHYKKTDFPNELITERDSHIENVIDNIDAFFAPSHTLEKYFLDMGVCREKVLYSKYGFNIDYIKEVTKFKGPKIRFGFMGRIMHTKGVHILCEAFSKITGDSELVIWGDYKSTYGLDLKKKYESEKIKFMGEFHTDNLQRALESFDIIICPSIWLENAPLVIQEAQTAKIPVITSNRGGMAELVHDGIDGFLFELGNVDSLQNLLQALVDDPQKIERLKPSIEKVRSIQDDANFCMEQYKKILVSNVKYPHGPSPWRVTLVTNPDKCNLHCKMCDTFSKDNCHKLKENHRPEMDFSLVKNELIRLSKLGMKEIIPSTMGEPLLYSNFDELVDLCKVHHLKMNLTTNGTFPIKGVEYWAEKLIHIISDVKFSINGINPEVNESIMCGAKTENQLKNISYWIQKKNEQNPSSTVTLQCTFMKSNLHELKNIVKWGIENGVDRVKGHHLWKTAESLDNEILRTAENVEEWNQVVDECKTLAHGKIKLANFEKIESLNPMENKEDTFCQFLGKELWIEHDGSFQICCCPSNVRKDFGYFGNIQDSSITQMWNSDQYKEFIRCWGDHENCRKCNMRVKR